MFIYSIKVEITNMSDDTIKIDLVKAQEAIIHLKDAHKELKVQLKELDASLQEKSEEVRDIFYISETTRKKLEELSEALDEAFKGYEGSFKKYDDLFSQKEEAKSKRFLTIVQAVVTALAVAYAALK